MIKYFYKVENVNKVATSWYTVINEDIRFIFKVVPMDDNMLKLVAN